MSIILSIYTVNAFKEFLLPSINNADHEIILQREFFDLKDNLTIKMEVIDGSWKIKRDYSYSLRKEGQKQGDNSLRDKDVWSIQTRNQEKISMIIKEVDSVFHSYDKYTLKGINKVRIGRA